MRTFVVFIALFCSLYAQPLEVEVRCEGAILMNAETGAVLFEKRGHEPTFPASTTKIGTALYAMHCLGEGYQGKMTVTRECVASITPQAKKQSDYRSPPHWLETDGTHIGLKKGEEMPFEDILHAVLVRSANDASNVVAQNVAGSIPKFVEGMNAYLQELGCLNTTFNNPHGLHHPDHRTTPYDLAMMARVGLKNKRFASIVRKTRYVCPETNLEHERTFIQSNRLLRNGPYYDPRVIGVKTGTTQAAGKNLVSAAVENGRTLIAVVLGCRGPRGELYGDITSMFDAAFNEQKMRRYLLKKGATDLSTTVQGARRKLATMLPNGLYYDYYPAEECAVKAKVQWEIPELPIEAGTPVGYIQVVDAHGRVVQKTSLLAAKLLKPTFAHKMRTYFKEENRGKKWLFLLGCSALVLFLLRSRKKRSKRPLF